MKLQLRKYDFLWYSKGLDLFSGDPPLILYHQINHPFHHIDLASTFLLSLLVYTLLYVYYFNREAIENYFKESCSDII